MTLAMSTGTTRSILLVTTVYVPHLIVYIVSAVVVGYHQQSAVDYKCTPQHHQLLGWGAPH